MLGGEALHLQVMLVSAVVAQDGLKVLRSLPLLVLSVVHGRTESFFQLESVFQRSCRPIFLCQASLLFQSLFFPHVPVK